MPDTPLPAAPKDAARPRDRSAAIALSIVAVLVIACAAFGVGAWRLYAHSVKRSDDAWVATPLAAAGGDPRAQASADATADTRPQAGIVVIARFRRDDLSAIRVGQAARVRLAGTPGPILAGRVQAIGEEDGQAAGSAGNFVQVAQRRPVRIAADATPMQRHLFRPGVAARVEIDTRSGR